MIRQILSRLQGYPLGIKLLLGPLILVAICLSPVPMAFQVAGRLLDLIGAGLRRIPGVPRLEADMNQVLAALTPSRDQSRQPPPDHILLRARQLRYGLAVFVPIEWAGLLLGGLGASVGALGYEYMAAPAGWAMMIMFVAGLPAWMLYSRRTYLKKLWRQIPHSLCPLCGYTRDYLLDHPCPECGCPLPPVSPGSLPYEWHCRSGVFGEFGAVGPYAMFGSLGVSLLVVSRWLERWAIGVFVLTVTVSLATVALIGARQAWNEWQQLRRLHQIARSNRARE